MCCESEGHRVRKMFDTERVGRWRRLSSDDWRALVADEVEPETFILGHGRAVAGRSMFLHWPPSSRSPIRVLVASLYSKQIANKLIQAWNESVQDCFMGVVHVAVEKIISPPNHCRLAAIYVSRFDGPMLMAFSGWSTHVLEASQVDAWLPRDVERRVALRKEHWSNSISSATDISAIYCFSAWLPEIYIAWIVKKMILNVFDIYCNWYLSYIFFLFGYLEFK